MERAILDLMEAMSEKVAVRDVASLYTYSVPMLTEDGTCSVVDQLAPVPYDLTAILGGRSEQTTRRLALLERLVERVQETTGAEWIGIYQNRATPSGAPVLVKPRSSTLAAAAKVRNSACGRLVQLKIWIGMVLNPLKMPFGSYVT